jgi:hypothetical protein
MLIRTPTMCEIMMIRNQTAWFSDMLNMRANMATASYHGVTFSIARSDAGWRYRYEIDGHERRGVIDRAAEFVATRHVWALIDRDLKRLAKTQASAGASGTPSPTPS